MRAKTVGRPELMIDASDQGFRTFIHDFLAFSQMVSDIRAGFGEYIGLTGIGYTTLISISHLQGATGIGVNAIAEHLHLSGAFITTEVAKLVRAGLVRKRVNAKDKRRVLLTVTPAGRKLLNKLAVVQAPVNDALFETLSRRRVRPPQGDDGSARPVRVARPLAARLPHRRARRHRHLAGFDCDRTDDLLGREGVWDHPVLRSKIDQRLDVLRRDVFAVDGADAARDDVGRDVAE